MAFSSLSVNAAGLLNQFAWPVALARIGWRTYIIFVIWCAVQWCTFFFLLPETERASFYLYVARFLVQFLTMFCHSVRLRSWILSSSLRTRSRRLWRRTSWRWIIKEALLRRKKLSTLLSLLPKASLTEAWFATCLEQFLKRQRGRYRSRPVPLDESCEGHFLLVHQPC